MTWRPAIVDAIATIRVASSIVKNAALPTNKGLGNDDEEPRPAETHRRNVPLAKTYTAREPYRVKLEAPAALPVELRPARVPTTQFGRMFKYGGLAAGLGVGTIGEQFKRSIGLSSAVNSAVISKANVDRVVNTLSKMRGAALKLGQMLSIQDNDAIPIQIRQMMTRLQNQANYMPQYQLEQVMRSELGTTWRDKFESFEMTPFAAASIGQVHKAQLAVSGQEVAVKVQYPGVGKSMESDLNSLASLATFSGFLPKGLYLENTIKQARIELLAETDYVKEADSLRQFHSYLKDDEHLTVPIPFEAVCTKRVLTMEYKHGITLAQSDNFPQDLRNYIASSILRLCLRELFEFGTMQTDPNWSNFLYDQVTGKIVLLDFGATQRYSRSFTLKYLRLLQAAAQDDTSGMLKHSKDLGFLTGAESKVKKASTKNLILNSRPRSWKRPI